MSSMLRIAPLMALFLFAAVASAVIPAASPTAQTNMSECIDSMISGTARSIFSFSPVQPQSSITTNPSNMSTTTTPVVLIFVGCMETMSEPPVLYSFSLKIGVLEGLTAAARGCAVGCLSQYPSVAFRALAAVNPMASEAICKCYGDTRPTPIPASHSLPDVLGGCRTGTLVEITTFCPQNIDVCSAVPGCTSGRLPSSPSLTCCQPFATVPPDIDEEYTTVSIIVLVCAISLVVLEVAFAVWYRLSKHYTPHGLSNCKTLRDEGEANALAEILLMSLTPRQASVNANLYHSDENSSSSSSALLFPLMDGDDEAPQSVLSRPRCGERPCLPACPVCMELAGGGMNSVVVLQCCGVSLHKPCLQQLLARKLREYSTAHVCPVCFAELFPAV
jgi:hypothetical protein